MERVHNQMLFKRNAPQTIVRHIIGFIPPRTKTWCEWFTTVYAYILTQNPMSDHLEIHFDRFSLILTRRDRAHTTITMPPDNHRYEFINPRPGHNDYRVLSLLHCLCCHFGMWSYGDQSTEMIFLRRHPHFPVHKSIERHPLSRRLLVISDHDALIRRLSALNVNITNPIDKPSGQISMVEFLDTFPEHTRNEMQQYDDQDP